MQTIDGPVPIPTDYVWEQYAQQNAVDPRQESIAGVPDFDHGTYQSRPYYAFIETAAGPVLVSDEGLRAHLTYIPGSLTTNKKDPTNIRKGAKFALSFPEMKDPIQGAILSLNDETSDELSFTVRGTPATFAALPSGRHPFGTYLVSCAKTPNYQKNTQSWGDIFTPKKFAFGMLMKSWDVTRMDMERFESTGTNTALLMTPDGDTKNYEQVGEHAIVPYGWIYRPLQLSVVNDRSTLVSSNRDVMNSVMKTVGFKLSGGISTKIGPVDVSADFSYANNQGLNEKQRDATGREVTRSEHKSIFIEGAYVVDKRNVALNDRSDDGKHAGAKHGFQGAIAELQRGLQETIAGETSQEDWQEVLRSFFKVWGTHYVFAATFGAKGTSTNTYTKKEVQQLLEKRVNLDTAWSAGANINVFGVGAHLKTEGELKEGKENEEQLKSVNGSGFSKTITVGSEAPNGRVPIYLDLRPISDLLGPPFFTDEFTAITLRDQVADAMKAYAMKAAEATDTLDVLKSSELTFGPCRVTIAPQMSAIGRVTISGPDVVLPLHSIVPNKCKGLTRPFEDRENVDSAGVSGAGGSSIMVVHTGPGLTTGYALMVAAQPSVEQAPTTMLPPVVAGWFHPQTLQAAIDVTEARTIKIGPSSASTNDGKIYKAVTIEFDVTVRPVELASLLGLED